MDSERSVWINRFWVFVWSLFFVGIFGLLIFSLLSQRQTSTGGVSETVKVISLTCKSENYLYPFLEFDESERKELKIVATFDEDKLESISLHQVLYYNDADLIKQSEAENHAAINISFSGVGLGADALGANYAMLSDAVDVGLYGAHDDLTGAGMKYFMLDTIKSYDYTGVKQVYEKLGMKCVGENV